MIARRRENGVIAGRKCQPKERSDSMVEVCIMCHNELSAERAAASERVADTAVIRAIRRVKTRLKMATNNTLVVCSDCLETHAKRLKSYERKMMIHAALAVILVILIILVPLLAGAFNPGSILVGILMGGLILALPLMDYVPPLASGRDVLAEIKAAQAQAAAAQAQASASLPFGSLGDASARSAAPAKPGLSIPFFGKPSGAGSSSAASAGASASAAPSSPSASGVQAGSVPPIWSSMKESRPRLWGKKSTAASKSNPAHSKSKPAHHKSKPAHSRRR